MFVALLGRRVRRLVATAVWLSVLCLVIVGSPFRDALGMVELDGVEEIPIERLISNLSRRVTATPDDAKAHVTLARLHALAVAVEGATCWVRTPTESKQTEGPPEVPELVDGPSVQVRCNEKPSDGRREHFHAAIRHYRLGIALTPDYPLAHIGLAWLLDEGREMSRADGLPGEERVHAALSDEDRESVARAVRDLRSDIAAKRARAYRDLHARGASVMGDLVEARADLRGTVTELLLNRLIEHCWLDLALAHYVKAFDGALPGDLEQSGFDVSRDVVAEEAGEAILRLTVDQASSPEMKPLRDRVMAALEKLSGKSRWISPIIFPLRDGDALGNLLHPECIRSFDLDGDDIVEQWPWPTPDTAVLVWRPRAGTRIESGRQLFGSATWWMFWRSGYEALAALDDDGNGRLDGAELSGIGVWRDADRDAVCDDGEVQTAEEFGIVSIDTLADAFEGDDAVLWSARGVELSDGCYRPTYDWTPREVRAGDEVATR